jgi:hypothetical protein
MGEKYLSGHWSETLMAFWFGANGCEYIAFKGSHQILEFPCYKYPNPPTRIIQHTERIETLEDFNNALDKGKWFSAVYTEEASE